jgi:hypothetical protein
MEDKKIKQLGYMVVAASWLLYSAVRLPLQHLHFDPVMNSSTGWQEDPALHRYSIMMSVSHHRFLHGMIIDKWHPPDTSWAHLQRVRFLPHSLVRIHPP